MSPATAEVVTLGGRQFKLASALTANQDVWLMKYARRAGLMQLPTSVDREQLEIVVGRVYDEGVQLEIVAGWIYPAALEHWTKDGAYETIEFLGDLSEADDKKKLWALLARVIFDFFPKGTDFSPILTTALKQYGARLGVTVPSGDTTVPSTTENGTTSSETSPGGIGTSTIE